MPPKAWSQFNVQWFGGKKENGKYFFHYLNMQLGFGLQFSYGVFRR